MARKLSVLDRVHVAAPCPEPWSGMTGDDRVRHCARCDLNVYNLSEMTRADAEALILAREGRLCIRYYRRRDGTILTRDCPVGLALIRQKLARLVGAAAAAFAFVAGGLHALARGERGSQELRLRYFAPFESIIAWLTPRPHQVLSGVMVNFDIVPPSHSEQMQSPEWSVEMGAILQVIQQNAESEEPQ